MIAFVLSLFVLHALSPHLLQGSVLKASAGPYRCEVDLQKNSVYRVEWGAGYNGPGEVYPAATLIQRIRFWKSKQQVVVPLSAFSDLGDCHTVHLKAAGRTCIIQLNGGDASIGWSATITVKSGRVVRREVHDGEFPDRFYEVTQYVVKPAPAGE